MVRLVTNAWYFPFFSFSTENPCSAALSYSSDLMAFSIISPYSSIPNWPAMVNPFRKAASSWAVNPLSMSAAFRKVAAFLKSTFRCTSSATFSSPSAGSSLRRNFCRVSLSMSTSPAFEA